MADFDTQRALQKNRIRRRGIYLLPNLFTTAALFFGTISQNFAIMLAVVLAGIGCGLEAKLIAERLGAILAAEGIAADDLAVVDAERGVGDHEDSQHRGLVAGGSGSDRSSSC